jgi:hypothetical protein
MAYQAPRFVSQSSIPSFRRRRSGAFSEGSSAGRSIRSSYSSINNVLTVQVEDVDKQHPIPTVLLVHKSRERARIPSLPMLPPHANHPYQATDGLLLQIPEDEPHQPGLPAYNTEPVTRFSPIPLMSRHDRQPSSQSLRSIPSIPPLPRPDFPSDALRLFHAMPRLAYNGNSDTLSGHSTQLARPLSQASMRTSSTFAIRPSLKRPPMHASLSTADKLTRRFPISRSLRGVTRDTTTHTPISLEFGSSLDVSLGLDMERPSRWTVHKWCLFLSVCTAFAIGTAGLVCALLTWFKSNFMVSFLSWLMAHHGYTVAWDHADVLYVADYDILVLVTLASALLLVTFSIGMTGTILNSRPILAVYALLLWPALVAILAVGYTAYKRSAFALDRKLNLAWSQYYTALGRMVVQDSLRCCGYNSPLHEATATARCYARAPLPGCKGKLLRFERAALQTVWTAAFIVVPLHLANIIVALLCANHVTRTFGKGIVPRRYRLSGADVRADAQRIMGTLREVGAVVPPEMSRTPLTAASRDDRDDGRSRVVLDDFPGILRPGVYSSGNNLSKRAKYA